MAGLSQIKNTSIFTFIVLILGSIPIMCTGLIAPALPLIAKSYSHIPHYELKVKFIITIPQMVILLSSPIIGLLMNKLNRKNFLCFGVLIYSISGSMCAFVEDINHLLMLRAILGLGAAIALSVALTLIADCLHGAARTAATGLQTTVMSIGTVLTNLIGGVMADIDWRLNFLIYALPALLLPAAWYYLYDPRRAESNMPYDHNEKETGDNFTQNNLTILAVYVISIINMLLYYMIPLQIPFLLYSFGGINAKQIAIALAMETLFCAYFASKYKRWKKNRDFISIAAKAFAIMATSYIIVSVTSNYYIIVIGMAIYGIGMGIMMPNNNLWLVCATKPKNRGLVIGGFNSAIYLGKFSSAIIVHAVARATSLQFSYTAASFIMISLAIIITYGSDYIKTHNYHKG